MEHETLNLPTINSNSSEHVQVMYALGQLVQGQKDMISRLDVTNGKVINLLSRMDMVERWQSGHDGEGKGMKIILHVISWTVGVIVGGLTIYYFFHK
jgi:hypothetical protein